MKREIINREQAIKLLSERKAELFGKYLLYKCHFYEVRNSGAYFEKIFMGEEFDKHNSDNVYWDKERKEIRLKGLEGK